MEEGNIGDYWRDPGVREARRQMKEEDAREEEAAKEEAKLRDKLLISNDSKAPSPPLNYEFGHNGTESSSGAAAPTPNEPVTSSGRKYSDADAWRPYTITGRGINSQGNRYDTRRQPGGHAYHYSNLDGSYAYKNANGSKYYNDGKGTGTFTAPNGREYVKKVEAQAERDDDLEPYPSHQYETDKARDGDPGLGLDDAPHYETGIGDEICDRYVPRPDPCEESMVDGDPSEFLRDERKHQASGFDEISERRSDGARVIDAGAPGLYAWDGQGAECYDAGYDAGYDDGYDAGYDDGYDAGFDDGYDAGGYDDDY